MSLRVWLPLDGDLRNQGISNLNTIIMPTCATIDNTGKIGKCYTSDGSAAGVSTNFNFQASEFSIAAWVRINTRVNAWRCPIKLIHSTEKDYIGFCCEHNTQASYIGFHFYKTIDNTNTPIFDTYPITDMPIGEWVHLTVTYNGKTAIYYKNGIKVNSSTIAAAKQNAIANIDRIIMLGSDGGRSGAAVKSSLNDVRIYDHCLSAAEVKEIAQGLVLHYKLDGGLFGNPNLYTGSEKFTGSWNGSAAWATSSETYQNFVVKEKSTVWGGLSQNITCTQGDIFTISFWGKVESGGTIRSIHRSNLGNVTTGLTILDGNFMVMGDYWVRTTDNGTQWKRYWATLQISSSDVTYLQWRLENSTADKKFQICGIKLEKGNVATPWCPADSELEIDRTVVEDSSGYNHNGALTGSINMVADTPKYSCATNFPSGTGVHTQLNLTLSQFTISFWGKHTAINKMLMGSNVSPTNINTAWYWYGDNSFKFPSGEFYYQHNAGSAESLLNKWVHFAATYDGTKITIYRNGINEGTKAFTGDQILEYLSVGNGYGTAYRENGYISDFRIYCTPLLDTDVKQLYNVGMKVDKSQNIHTFEINEKNINIFSSTPWTNNFNNHSPNTNPFTNYNSNNEPQFTTNSSSAGSDYIVITPGIYEWDYTVSINAGNQFYIGFERYDADKTSRSNAATVYQLGFKPSENLIKKRFFGTVDLSTDGVNPIKYIALRILNGWSGTTSGVTGQATIHNLSLRLQSAATNPQLTKTGQLIGDEFKEYSNAKFYKDHMIEANHFIER